MIKRLATLIFTACALAMVSIPAGAQMSDDAVIAYVKSGMATGRSNNDMAKELAARGVTENMDIKVNYTQLLVGPSLRPISRIP